MSNYIKLFDTEQNQNIFRDSSNYTQPHVSCTETGSNLKYNKYNEEDWKLLNGPFTIEALSSGNITWALEDKTVQYSKNGGNGETMNNSTTISVVQGDKIQFKGTNNSYNNNTISSTAQFNVKGYIMSLTNGDNFKTADVINNNCFSSLFKDCEYLISAKDLNLSATTLNSSCYQYMFKNCTSLINAPKLPATTMASSCYGGMFENCIALITAPNLPATTLSDSCYSAMFKNCTSLINVPTILPATILPQECYGHMFDGCTSLTAAPELPDVTTFRIRCGGYMFTGCTNLVYVKAMFVAEPEYYNQSWGSSAFSGGLTNTGPGVFVKNENALWPGKKTTHNEQIIPDNGTVQTASA